MNTIYRSEEGQAAVRARYAALLDRWPVPSEQRRVVTRQGETFVVVCGPLSAPPVLLFQGSGANAAMWMPEVDAWAAHYRVYAVDVIGEPGFSAPSRPPLESDAYASWIDEVMDGLGLTRASLVGVSLGARIALDHAIRRPGRVDKVVVISPSGIGRQKLSFMLKVVPLTLMGRWGRRKAMALATGPMRGPFGPLDREVGLFAAFVSKHVRYRRGAVPRFGDDDLKRLTMPVMAIVGAGDALLDSKETKRRLERLVPQATVQWLPDVGHVVRHQTATIQTFLGS